jgi:GDP-L-fucose synthase
MKNKKTLLILGASGFIGKNLIEILGKKYKIYSPSHKELDLMDSEAVNKYFKSHKIDVVIDGAVVGGSRKEEHEENALNSNLRIFFNLINNKKYYKKMIHFGSGAEYDKRFPIAKVREEDFDKRVPVDDYGFSKYLISKYIEQSEDIVCLRIFGLFGKYEDYRYRFISNAICRNIFGLPITMNQDVYFDYVYINDFARIVEYFIEYKAKHKSYNVGTGKRVNLKTIANKINIAAKNKSKIIIKKRGLNNEYTCDNSRLLSEIKGLEFKSIDDSISELYKWYYENKLLINKNSL